MTRQDELLSSMVATLLAPTPQPYMVDGTGIQHALDIAKTIVKAVQKDRIVDDDDYPPPPPNKLRP